jgi:hypothetical protein
VTTTDNAVAGPTVQTFSLATTAWLPLTVSPATLSFPTTPVGGTSAPLQVTATNYSTASVTVNGAVASGDYSILSMGSNPCAAGMVLAPATSCTFGVSFTPTITGAIAGVATFGNTTHYSPQIVSLTGSGH